MNDNHLTRAIDGNYAKQLHELHIPGESENKEVSSFGHMWKKMSASLGISLLTICEKISNAWNDFVAWINAFTSNDNQNLSEHSISRSLSSQNGAKKTFEVASNSGITKPTKPTSNPPRESPNMLPWGMKNLISDPFFVKYGSNLQGVTHNKVGKKAEGEVENAKKYQNECLRKSLKINQKSTRINLNKSDKITGNIKLGACAGGIFIMAREYHKRGESSLSNFMTSQIQKLVNGPPNEACAFQMVYENITSNEPFASEFMDETLKSLEANIHANPNAFEGVSMDDVKKLLAKKTESNSYEDAIERIKSSNTAFKLRNPLKERTQRSEESIEWAIAILTVMKNLRNRKNPDIDMFQGVDENIVKHMRLWNNEKNSRASFNFACLGGNIKEISVEDKLGSSSMYQTDAEYLNNIERLSAGFYTCSFKMGAGAHVVNFIIDIDGSGYISDLNGPHLSFKNKNEAASLLAKRIGEYPLPVVIGKNEQINKHELTIGKIIPLDQ